jgi:hypothetical protein
VSSIVLKQHVFKVGHSPFAHNFLVLHDDDGNVVSEIHGLAVDPATGTPQMVGRSNHNLRVDELQAKSQMNVAGQPEHVLLQRPGDDLRATWQAARDALHEINSRKLTYNPLGGDFNGPRDWDAPVPPVIAGNSNSVNRTLVEAMGLRLPSMPYMAPGIENPLLRQQETEQFARNNGLPIPKGGLF